MDLNYYVLLVFAPLLILAGVLGFVIPANKSLTSGAPSYNVFHIIFGVIGIAVIYSGHAPCFRVFNVAFGLIDLYQAVASFARIFPEKYFRWTRVDDVLHVVIGIGLVATGLGG